MKQDQEDDRDDDFKEVAKTSEVADGAIITVAGIDRVDLCILNLKGTFYAFSSVCTHKGGPLAQGEIRGEFITCPWHYANFRIRDGKNYWPAPGELRTYETMVKSGSIFVRLRKDIPDSGSIITHY